MHRGALMAIEDGWARERERARARSVRVWKAIAGGSAIVALGTVAAFSCVDRDGTRRRAESQGPAPTEEVGTTEVTSGEQPRAQRPSAPRAAPPAPAAAPAPAEEAPPLAGADAGAQAGVLVAPDAGASLAELIDLMKEREAREADAAAQIEAEQAADAGAPPEAAPAPAAADAGAPTPEEVWRQYNRPPMDIGAGSFTTEPPPWAASSWTPNPQAGAGPFQTERTAPPAVIFFGVPAQPPQQQQQAPQPQPFEPQPYQPFQPQPYSPFQPPPAQPQ